MAGTLSIQLKNVRFFAAHGLHAEEALVGNEFEIDVSIAYKASKKLILSIEETVNYVTVFQLVEDVMREPQDLLETCAMMIVEKLHQQYTFIKEVSISIRKIHAPITNFTGTVGVTYSKRFK